MTQSQQRRYLLVAAAFEGRAEHHATLQLGKRSQAGQRVASGQPPLSLQLDRRQGSGAVDVDRLRSWPAQLADGHVVDYSVQPGTHLLNLDTAPERHPGLEQRLLEHVFRRGVARADAAAVDQELLAVAMH